MPVGIVAETIQACNMDDLDRIKANKLNLWVLQEPWSTNDAVTGLRRCLHDDGLESAAELLDSFSPISTYFAEPPPEEHLHLIVQAPINGAGEVCSLHALDFSIKRCCQAQCLIL